MFVKYYGTSKVEHYEGWTACHPVITQLWSTDPHKNTDYLSPSYCVMLVPGSFDAEGDDLVYGTPATVFG